MSATASILTEQKFKSHLRWNFFVEQKDVVVTKTATGFYLETLNLSLYKKLKKSLENIELKKRYFKSYSASSKGFPTKPATIKVELASTQIELFSFYRQKENKYVIDFWRNADDVDQKISEVKPRQKKAVSAKTKKTIPIKVVKDSVKTEVSKSKEKKTRPFKSIENNLSEQKITKVKTAKDYRDFRYGASYIWNYPAFVPMLGKTINLGRKTPEYFYPIKDRDLTNNKNTEAAENVFYDDRYSERFKKSAKADMEAHMQLSINLYRKGKYGLMSKSIRLFQQKYGLEKYNDLNDYLKANALIKENLNNDDPGPFKSAMTILRSISDRTTVYSMKSGILKYQLQYLLEEGSYIDSLEVAKKLYVTSKSEFDRETSDYAAQVIFHSLAKLKQVEKIEKFANEISIKKLVAPQTLLAYQIYVLHKEKNTKEIINLYEAKAKGLQRPIKPSILYNVAESYFRNSKFKKAIKVYDDFIKYHSYTTEASFARVRLALSYEILEKDTAKVISLYENAINRASNLKARYEAKVRYVALINARKSNPSSSDREKIAFLEYSNDEKSNIDDNLKKLLWIVRLRTLVNTGKYSEALSYITALPVKTMKPMLKKMFEGDGAEIVYGMIQNSFNNDNYPRVVKLWEIYRELYEDKVAGEPYLNFLVAQSYINLGLENGLMRTIDNLQRIKSAPRRTFPIWVRRINFKNINALVSELNILKLIRGEKWDEVISKIDGLNTSKLKKLYYKTIANYKLSNSNSSVKEAEEFLRKSPSTLPLNRFEIGQFFEAYLESLFLLGKTKRFKLASNALLKDINKHSVSDTSITRLKEKVNYLLIESLASSSKPADSLLVLTEAQRFIENFKDSIYKGRVRYLLGSHMLKNERKEKGLQVLNGIINDEDVADYIKELSKTEIASLRLEDRILN